MRNAASHEKRCSWVNMNDPLLVEYHDHEWGVPVHSDNRHLEVLTLSGAQAGLNWSLVLKKRDGYRRAFDGFDPDKVTRYTEKRIEKLLVDPTIIRNRMKIEAAVANARARYSRFAKNSAILIPIAGGSSTAGLSSIPGELPYRSRQLLPIRDVQQG